MWRRRTWVLGLLLQAVIVPAAAEAFSRRPEGLPAGLRADVARARAAGLPSRLPPAARPARLLVLLVEFPDQPAAGNSTLERLEAATFGDSASVASFYRQSSYGRFELQGTVVDWVRAPRTLAFYADGKSGIGGTSPRNARAMVADAVRRADPFVDFAQFDNDGPDGIPASGDDDGQVDALMVVHAGEGAELGDRNTILSHSWFTPAPVTTADGVFVWRYATVSEFSPLGVRAHEFGHLLGLPDLYDLSARSVDAAGGLGYWSLMGVGSWLGAGRTPSDLDAPSKIELGFVDPIVPQAPATALPLRAGAPGAPPDVYQIWTHGEIGPEFLVVENRRRSGLDAQLPGSGMLVYHVDLRNVDNDDPDALRVQLLQADGRRDLERFQSSGDAGDPFPGSTGRARLDASGEPNTRRRDGGDSQIVITGIGPPTATMHFDLQIDNVPALRVVRHRLAESQGDGDGFPEPGETIDFTVTLANVGTPAEAGTWRWETTDGTVLAWTIAQRGVPALGRGDSTQQTFQFVAPADLMDPAVIALRGTVTEAGGRTHVLERVVALGRPSGLDLCPEVAASRLAPPCSTAGAWEVETTRGTNTWTLERDTGDVLGHYRSAAGPRYAPSSDTSLRSPWFHLAPGSRLELLHAWATQDLAAGWCHDGGRVEIQLDGGAWEVLVPEAGYPRRLDPPSVPELARSGVFGGPATRRWDRFDLGVRAGAARLRFRFVSDDSIGARGWEIYRIEVQATASPSRPSPGLRVLAEPNPLRLPDGRVTFRVDAPRTAASQPARMRLFDVRGRLVRRFDVPAVVAESRAFVWDGTDRDGRPVASGIYIAQVRWGGLAGRTKVMVLR